MDTFYPLLVNDNQPLTWWGLYIMPSKGETVRETLERCTQFDWPSTYPVIDLVIKAPCGNEATYKTLDDIPQNDVPCPCGNPNHMLVKIGEMKWQQQ